MKPPKANTAIRRQTRKKALPKPRVQPNMDIRLYLSKLTNTDVQSGIAATEEGATSTKGRILVN